MTCPFSYPLARGGLAVTLWDIIGSSLKRRWRKAIILTVGLFLATSISVALFSASKAMREEVADSFDQIGANISIIPTQEELSLNYGGISLAPSQKDTLLQDEALQKIRTIANAESIARVAPKVLGHITSDGQPVTVVGVSFADELKMKKWWKITGDQPRGGADILIGEKLAAEKGWHTGQSIDLNGKTFRISGQLVPTGSDEDNLLFMDWKQAQDLLQMQGKLSFIEVSALCSTCPIDDITAQIGTVLPGSQVTALKETLVAREGIVDRFTTLSLVVGAVTTIAGMLLVFLLVSSTMRERTKELGILRSIGFRKSHLMQMLLSEVVLLTIPAGAAGYLAGLSLSRWAAPIIVQMEVTVPWNGKEALLSVGITVLLGLIASLMPAWRGASKDPVEAMRML
nr:FtsX-like permease family protein [Heliobacterium chlorum]